MIGATNARDGVSPKMKIAKVDDFETNYVNKFRALASPYGIFLEYEKDRAAIDIGIHFTQSKKDGTKIVTPSIGWFQLKGIMASTLSAADFNQLTDIPISIPISHLRFWYYLPYPVYLAVYLEALDQFVVINAQRWIREHFQQKILSAVAQTTTIRIPKANKLGAHVFRIMTEIGQRSPVEKALEDADGARVFLRDDQIIKRLATAAERNAEMRVTVIKYGSKTRTEVYFEERTSAEDEWVTVRSHWHFMMGNLSGAFPYLDFEAFNEDNNIGTWQNHHFEPSDQFSWEYEGGLDCDEVLIMDDGCVIAGEGQFERMEYELRPSLNDLGKEWASILTALEKAEVMAVDETPVFVNVAPFAGFDL
jgi:hypothetical protein